MSLHCGARANMAERATTGVNESGGEMQLAKTSLHGGVGTNISGGVLGGVNPNVWRG